MSPLPRLTKNRGLPARWRFKHGAYYYRVPEAQRAAWDGKAEYRLGKTLPEAHRVWATKLELFADASTVGQLLDRYSLEVVPLKAPKSQVANQHSIKKLRGVFGHMLIAAVKPKDVFKYRDLRSKDGRTAANHDLEVLSHAYSKAIEWGLTDNHPIKGKVGKLRTPPRRRYIEDWELEVALTVASPFIRAYVRLKLLTGLRRADLLSIRLADITDDGLLVTPRKTALSTGQSMIYTWSDDLREAIEGSMQIRRKIVSPWLFHTNVGEPYLKDDGGADGFNSIWQRFMRKALQKTDLKERFTEHDLRAKVASDLDGLVRAQELLGHGSPAITDRVYRRKRKAVRPAG